MQKCPLAAVVESLGQWKDTRGHGRDGRPLAFTLDVFWSDSLASHQKSKWVSHSLFAGLAVASSQTPPGQPPGLSEECGLNVPNLASPDIAPPYPPSPTIHFASSLSSKNTEHNHPARVLLEACQSRQWLRLSSAARFAASDQGFGIKCAKLRVN